MGPPDKFEEFFPQPGSEDRGPTIWWIYYDYELGIEFADAKGTGTFAIREYTGDFFGAMDVFKLGRSIRADDVFTKKFFKFEAGYDPGSREIYLLHHLEGRSSGRAENSRIARSESMASPVPRAGSRST